MVFVMWAELVSNRFDRLLLGLRATPTNLQLLYSIYFFRVKRERSFFTFSGIFKTCSNTGMHSCNRCSIKQVSL